jgi:hypothetical protein
VVEPWCSGDDFSLHFAYTNEFSIGQQSADWLAEKDAAHKSKFETNQKNWLEELAKKWKAEEDEWQDAAKNRKADVEDASAQLVLAQVVFHPTN